MTDARVEELSDALLEETLTIHLAAPFRLCRAVIPGMRAAGFGRIVNVSSQAALMGSVAHAHYAAAKAGLHGLTFSLAKELARRRDHGQPRRPGPDPHGAARGAERRPGGRMARADAGRPPRHAPRGRRGRRVPRVGGRLLRHRRRAERQRRALHGLRLRRFPLVGSRVTVQHPACVQRRRTTSSVAAGLASAGCALQAPVRSRRRTGAPSASHAATATGIPSARAAIPVNPATCASASAAPVAASASERRARAPASGLEERTVSR